MNKDFLIQLTKNIYKATLLFPKKEPLRYKMREVADDILIKPEKESLECLNSFIEVAKDQNWVNPNDLLAIQMGYDSLRESSKEWEANKAFSVAAESIVGEEETCIDSTIQSPAPKRHEKIIEALKERGKAQVWEINKLLPEVTKRTLRRDFEYMLNQGLVERVGEKNNTFYQLKDLKVKSA